MNKPNYSAPHSPGVYIMRDGQNKVLYVGKAKDLKNRVDSYFNDNNDHLPKTLKLVSLIKSIEFIVVHSEAESLILENNLIKQFQPPYNILLKEGSAYGYVKMTAEDFPRIMTVRNSTIKKGEKIIGPFPFGSSRITAVRLLQKTFKIRVCKTMPNKPCLQYYLGYCSAPCDNKISADDYSKNVQSAMLVLSGQVSKVIEQINEKMKQSSLNENYEAAIEYRNQIKALQKISQTQDVERPAEKNQAIIGFYHTGSVFYIQILNIIRGVLRSRDSFVEESVNPNEFVSEFLRAYYVSREIPDEIVLRTLPEDHEELKNWFTTKSNKKIEIMIAKNSSLANLMDLAEKNAALLLMQESTGAKNSYAAKLPSEAVLSLQRALNLQYPPFRIECFDISHLFGNFIVGSMVSSDNGEPYKAGYRKFRIRTVTGGKSDDPASIKEIVYRRYSRCLRERSKLPDLIVIDGGKGQLHAALDSLNELNLDIPCIALAKKFEEIYSPDEMQPIVLDKKSSALKLLQSVRDEAHRFGITYHRKLRGKAALTSPKEFNYE